MENDDAIARGAVRQFVRLAAEARLDLRNCSLLFKRLKIAKPKGGSLHLLRHSLASQMMDGGVPLPVVSARLGHSSIRTTAKIYSHAIRGADDDATKKWEQYRELKRTGGQPSKSVQ